MEPTILYEDNHLLVVNKPAGMLSQGDKTGDDSLDLWAGRYLKEKYQKPGNVYVGLVHRLDRPTSGVIVIARTGKAAERLSVAFRDGHVHKTYLAVVEGIAHADIQLWEDWLLKDGVTNQVAVLNAPQPGAKFATMRMIRLEHDPQQQRSSVELELITGRGHQLRAQLAARGLPVFGDTKYGAREFYPDDQGFPRIALHAAELRLKHPTRPDVVTFQAPLPSRWPKIGRIPYPKTSEAQPQRETR